MKSPFENDPFAVMLAAFEKIYPGKNPHCVWVSWISGEKEEGDTYGVTEFENDGTVWVAIVTSLPVKDALEIFAHELAHVAVGYDAGHNDEWETAYEAILTDRWSVVGVFGKGNHRRRCSDYDVSFQDRARRDGCGNG